MKALTNVIDGGQSYLASGLAYFSDIDWLTVGAVVLLAARLAKDVPDAYDAISARFKKKKKKKGKKRVKGKR